jgi:hypothetical protein
VSDGLHEMLEILRELSPKERKALEKDVFDQTKNRVWIPNLGPQTDGYTTEADELFYGGQAGGGKSDMIVGLALEEHSRSLIFRRFQDDADALADRAMELVGNRDGWNGQKHRLRLESDRVIDFGGMKEEKDKERYKGKPHDLIGFDEIPDFLKSQYEFVIAWNRSVDPEQRCRIVCAGNPPTQAEGLWVIDYWGAWLHPNHPNPAQEGELRWYTQDLEGNEIEVDGFGPHIIGGQKVYARSRTFIRAKLDDNPDLAATNYDAVLSKLPKELRAAYRDGRFDLGLKDRPWQIVPSAWVRAAQSRVAQGGDDKTSLAPRHGFWLGDIAMYKGVETPDGKTCAGKVLFHRRNNAEVILDMGGGYGGATYERLEMNGIRSKKYKGNTLTKKRTKDRVLKFANVRTATLWNMREMLDPDQVGGSKMALPNDPELFADLTAAAYSVERGVIKATSKEDLVKRLGRSTDKGDCAMMAFTSGDFPPADDEHWRADQKSHNMSHKKNRSLQANFGPRGTGRRRSL